MKTTIRPFALSALSMMTVFCAVPLLTGCGGGSGSVTRGAAPTARTRAAVQGMMGRHVNALNLSGVSSQNALTGSNTPASGGGANAGHGFVIPNLGGFFNQMAGAANSAHGGRAVHKVKRTRDVPSDYDEWLGLYTTITETDGRTQTLLFLDAAKTQPAGQIVSIFPSDYTVFPQVYQYTFSFTGGTQAGSSGHYDSTYNADGTYASEYASTFNDGSSYSGRSSYSADGTSSYSGSYSSTADNISGSYEGRYNADGSGFSRMSDSTGYASEYRYATNGSFTGTISGPDPGLPAQIVFDATTRKYTITYADGTSESYDWGYWEGANGDSGNSGSGDAGSGDTTNSNNTGNGRKAK